MKMTGKNYIAEFSAALQSGLDNIVKAASIYVEAIDRNPNNAFEFHSKFEDTIPISAWASFEAVGRKWIHPKLIMGGGGRHGCRIKKLPYSVQKQIFDGHRFELLLHDGDTIRIDLREASADHARQLFGGDHIRTLSEQRLYLAETSKAEAKQEQMIEKIRQMPYVIRGGRVFFREGVEMTKREIQRLIEEM